MSTFSSDQQLGDVRDTETGTLVDVAFCMVDERVRLSLLELPPGEDEAFFTPEDAERVAHALLRCAAETRRRRHGPVVAARP